LSVKLRKDAIAFIFSPHHLKRGRMRSPWLVGFLVFLLGLTALNCKEKQAPTLTGENESADLEWFEDVTERLGLNFIHDAGPLDGKYFMPQIVGSGAALFDCDGDGRLDIYLLQNGGPRGAPNRLFRQGRDGHFHDASAGSGLDFAGYSMGVAVGDVNNDGSPDVLVTQYGGVRLLLNDGKGVFTDGTERSGLSNPAWGTSAAFFDYDRDGWLDLVVVNYVDYDRSHLCNAPNGGTDYCTPKVFAGRVSQLFRNLGGEGRVGCFRDVTLASGLGSLTGPGLGVVCADFDGDGWADIFIANDGQPNRLWINQKNGTFKEEAVLRGAAYNGMGQAGAGMGIAHADLDGDGLSDLFVTHLRGETNNLWSQGPRGLFQDRTGTSGLGNPHRSATGFGVVAADFDHDGWPDLAIANGGVARTSAARSTPIPSLGPHWSAYAEHNQLFVNTGAGRFREASASSAALCGTPNVARGLIAGDLDGDGAPDLLLTTAGGRARILLNVAPHRGHWLRVRCLERVQGRERDARGAMARVRAGNRSWVRMADSAGSYLCAGDPRAHFGLGTTAHVETIEVRWPDGVWESFGGGAVDCERPVRKGSGTPLKDEG
jgi:enediyne biosynthesis protein E4